MDIKKYKKTIKLIFATPSLYVALVIGALLGAIGGGLSGCIASILSYSEFTQQLISLVHWPETVFGYTLSIMSVNLLIGALIGAVIGAVIGGFGIALATALCTVLNKKLPENLSSHTIKPVIKFCCIIAGIFIGAILLGLLMGTGVDQFFGPIVGALFGFAIALLAVLNWVRTNA